MRDQRRSLLAQVKGLLRQFDLKTKKRLGQHFLIDKEVLEQIVLSAELTSQDVVVEVGPGLGLLTKELAKKANRVIAVELDVQFVSMLKKTLSSFANIFIVQGDILKIPPAELLGRYAVESTGYKVVANLPYYITSPVLRHFLEASVKPKLMVVMVQKEVGEAIGASSRNMNLLSISVQFYAKPQIVAYVPAQSFYPPPKVDSAILRLDLLPQPAVVVNDVVSFFNTVRCGFSSRRKQLHNSLAKGLGISAAEVVSILKRVGIEPQRRAETLTLEEWAKVWREVKQLKGKVRHANNFSTG